MRKRRYDGKRAGTDPHKGKYDDRLRKGRSDGRICNGESAKGESATGESVTGEEYWGQQREEDQT